MTVLLDEALEEFLAKRKADAGGLRESGETAWTTPPGERGGLQCVSSGCDPLPTREEQAASGDGTLYELRIREKWSREELSRMMDV